MQNHNLCRYRTTQNCKFLQKHGQCMYKHEVPKQQKSRTMNGMQPQEKQQEYRPKYQPVQNSQSIQQPSTSSSSRMQQNVEPPISDEKVRTQPDIQQPKYVRRDAKPMQEEERAVTPLQSSLIDKNQKPQKKHTKPCKYGESCKDFKNNRCNFLHEIHEEPLMLRHIPKEEEQTSYTNSSLGSKRNKDYKKNSNNIDKDNLESGAASMMRDNQYRGHRQTQSTNQEDSTRGQTSQRTVKHDMSGLNQGEISGVLKFLQSINTNDTPREEKKMIEDQIQQLQRMQRKGQPQVEEEQKQPSQPLSSRQNNQNQNRRDHQEKVSFFSYQFLKDIQDLPFDDLKMKLHGMNSSNLIERLNGTELKIDSCLILLEILEKLLNDKQSQISLNLLSSFVESKFADNLLLFLKSRANNLEKRATSIFKAVKIMIDLIDLFPSQYMKFPVDQINMETRVVLANQSLQFKDKDALEKENSKLFEKYIEVRTEQEVQIAQNKQNGRGRARLIPQDNSYQVLPQTDFKDIDIIPGERQFREEGKIRKMPEKGDLLDSHNYLDLIFRLLHEDAITDLRNGIKLFKRIGQLQLNRKELRSRIRDAQIKLYENMTIDSLQVIDGCGCFQFRLPMIKKKFIDWRICKKLLPGSLVILSPDKFNTLFIALLMNTDAQERNKTHQKFGYVAVNIQIIKATVDIPTLHELHTQYGSDSFQMIESTAYFESYKHVLQQMKDMDTWLPNLDISRFLIHGKADQLSPPYIEKIFDEKYLELNEQIQNLQLDQSQRKALQNALTLELALIQGPPGTGKTYLGVQLVKILLNFKDYWCQDGPILLVTYTNHALNQFLLHVSKFTEKIARIGGRAPKEDEEGADLERFNIRNLVRAQPQIRGLYKTRKELEEIKKRIDDSKRKLVKYQLHFITTLIEDKECEYSSLIIKSLKEDFPSYLKNVLRERFNFINIAQQQYILDEIKFLRESTNWNILVVFWLGIIDLVSFIEDRLNNYELMNQAKSEEQKKKEEEELKEEQENKKLLEEKGDKYDEIERELDFERQQVGNDENVDYIWNAINDVFKIEIASPALIGFNQIDSLQELLQQNKSPFNQENESVLPIFMNNFMRQNLYTDCPLNIRWLINNHLIGRLLNNTTGLLDFQIEKYKNVYKVKEELENLEAKAIIKQSLIVAMTTTGRAKYSQMLKEVNFPIIIVEEAAEVFEAHIVASLSHHTQHLVLIGDHEQLKPNPAVYDLSFNFNLSMSMFERLIKNEIQHSTLDVQRRMRPEIAQIVKFIYPTLQDHEIVGKYPNVKGLNSNIFFFDHQWPENTHELMQSKFNTKEAEMSVRFVFYLLQQKYKPTQITILTLYTGQLLKIKSMIRDNNNYRDNFRGVRVTSVDNYQGEENDIIILSLVRSNPENKIGFLKITNRVCVALSRAKQGLFIFGNSKCLLGSKLKLWEDVVTHLQAKSFIGNSLIFKCVNHDNIAEVKEVSDFAKVPEGGCQLRCNVRIPCGHTCERMCHPYEKTEIDPTGHENVKCKKPCARTHECGHQCTYKCFECKAKKMDCKTKVEKHFRPCNHTMNIECHEYFKINKCQVDCEKKLLCGHKCKQWCSTPCNSKPCKESVEKELPCGHTIDMDCFKDPNTEYCYKPCDKLLECGHPCPNKCGECKKDGHHGKCKQKCSRNLVCGHACKYPCTKNCPPCQEEVCMTSCPHSNCSLKCQEVCILCKEPCINKCEHSQCTNLCSEPCNKPLCNEPCKVVQECGHPCIGVCGEKCPQICRVCKPDDQVFSTFFGDESEVDAKFIQIDCGHIFEVFGFDKYMTIKQDDETVQFKKCPLCKDPIMKVRRYMNQINSTLNDINAIKALTLKQDEDFKKSVAQTREELKLLKDKLSAQDRTLIYFKTFQKVLDHANKRVNMYEDQRSSTFLNEMIDMIPFFNSLFQLAKICQEIGLNGIQLQDKNKIDVIFQYANDFMRGAKITQQTVQLVQRVTKQLSDKYKLSQSEIKQILKATGLGAGHWNKCPNGHYYVIGDCGGAMEQARCPDCKAVIGGRDHALAAGNQHARELDDERIGPAWNPQGFDNMVMQGNINLDRIIDHD